MQSASKYGGIIVPILTPFTPDGRVDRAAVKRIVNFQIENGVHGLFLVGTFGEGLSMPAEERVVLVGAVAEACVAAKASLPLYVSISGNCLRESVEIGGRFMEVGQGLIAALVAHAPFYFPVTAKELDRYFQLLADSLSAPLMIYNIPITTKVSIPIETVQRLMNHPRVVGIKDSDREVPRAMEMYAATGGRKDFALLVGNGFLATEGMKRGGCGVVISGGNIVPGLWVKWWNAVQEAQGPGGDWTRAVGLQAELDAVTSTYSQGRTIGEAVAILKGQLAKRGLCDATVLPPLITEGMGGTA